MYVKPGPNTFEPETLGHVLHVRNPETGRVLPPEGAEVPETSHWLRLLRDGDVVLATPETGAMPEPGGPAAP